MPPIGNKLRSRKAELPPSWQRTSRPYFVEYIRQLLVAKFGEAMVYKGGLEVFTTLNADMQKAAEAAVFNGLREVDKRQGWRGPLRTVDLATLEVPAPDPSVKLAEGDIMEGVVTKIAKDHVLVQIGGSDRSAEFRRYGLGNQVSQGQGSHEGCRSRSRTSSNCSRPVM
jgi:penicillin-binding protein 1A